MAVDGIVKLKLNFLRELALKTVPTNFIKALDRVYGRENWEFTFSSDEIGRIKASHADTYEDIISKNSQISISVNPLLTIRYPELTISNGSRQEEVEDYFATLAGQYLTIDFANINSPIGMTSISRAYRDLSWGFYGDRRVYSFKHFIVGYKHSHLPGGYTPREYSESYPNSFKTNIGYCLGHNPFRDDKNTKMVRLGYDNSRTSIEEWMLFFYQIDATVNWESLDGGPHFRMSTIPSYYNQRFNSNSSRINTLSQYRILNKELINLMNSIGLQETDLIFKFSPQNNIAEVKMSPIGERKIWNYINTAPYGVCARLRNESLLCKKTINGTVIRHDSTIERGFSDGNGNMIRFRSDQLPFLDSKKKIFFGVFNGEELYYEIKDNQVKEENTNDTEKCLHPEFKEAIEFWLSNQLYSSLTSS